MAGAWKILGITLTWRSARSRSSFSLASCSCTRSFSCSLCSSSARSAAICASTSAFLQGPDLACHVPHTQKPPILLLLVQQLRAQRRNLRLDLRVPAGVRAACHWPLTLRTQVETPHTQVRSAMQCCTAHAMRGMIGIHQAAFSLDAALPRIPCYYRHAS